MIQIKQNELFTLLRPSTKQFYCVFSSTLEKKYNQS